MAVPQQNCILFIAKCDRSTFASNFSSLHHRNLVKILGVCTYPQEIHILMELVEGQDLRKIMQAIAAASEKEGSDDESLLAKRTRSSQLEKGKPKTLKVFIINYC